MYVMKTPISFNFIIIFIATVMIIGCNSVEPDNSDNKLSIKVAGYNYDRIRAIKDGIVSIEGADVSFTVENIYV